MAQYSSDLTSTSYAIGSSYVSITGTFCSPVVEHREAPFTAAFDNVASEGVLTTSECGFRAYYWQAANGNAGQWIGQNFGSSNKKHIRKINYWGLTAGAKIIQASNDNSNWVDIYSWTSAYATSWTTILLPATNSYQYWRIYCNSTASYHRCCELEMMIMTVPDTYSYVMEF